jgi:hypothetical protein
MEPFRQQEVALERRGWRLNAGTLSPTPPNFFNAAMAFLVLPLHNLKERKPVVNLPRPSPHFPTSSFFSLRFSLVAILVASQLWQANHSQATKGDMTSGGTANDRKLVIIICLEYSSGTWRSEMKKKRREKLMKRKRKKELLT